MDSSDNKKKVIVLSNEACNLILSELKETFPYIKKVELNYTINWTLQNLFTRSYNWEVSEINLNLFVDKSYEDEINEDTLEFYDYEKNEYIEGFEKKVDDFINKFYSPWEWILDFGIAPHITKKSISTNFSKVIRHVGFEFV